MKFRFTCAFFAERAPARALRLTLLLTLGVLAACGGGGSGSQCESCGDKTGAPVLAQLSGRVLDTAGLPVAGVTVSVFHHNTNITVMATTDAGGGYTVSGLDTLRNAEYEVYAGKTGYGFAPVANDAAAISRLDFNGLYRTVMLFLNLPAHDVTNANFTAYRAGDKVASLPQTGQTVSYASGDDFAARKGVAWPAKRFTDNGDGSVTDGLSGLVWLKDAGCFAASDWSSALTAANQLASGACGLSDGSSAGTWRLPNANELESLVDVAQFNPAVSAGHPFTHINLAAAYWSSTTYMASTANAMAIRFTDGRWINGIDGADGGFNNAKSSSRNALWAVKSGSALGAVRLLATGVFAAAGGGSFGPRDDASLQLGAVLTTPRFIDQGDGTLADTVTGLTWLKKADCLNQPWAAALASVNQLASGQCGLNDGSTAGRWRMPNRNEMLSLSDRAPTFPQASYLVGQYQAGSVLTGPVIFNNFVVSHYYWTSSTDAADASQAWSVYNCDFGVYNLFKSESHFTLAVR
jgi:hypothetical protein